MSAKIILNNEYPYIYFANLRAQPKDSREWRKTVSRNIVLLDFFAKTKINEAKLLFMKT